MKKTHVKILLRIGALLAVAVTGANVAEAQSCNVEWTGNAGDGLWSTAGNWSTNQVPGPTSDVCILTGGVNASTTPSISIHSMQVGSNNVRVYIGSGTVSIATSLTSQGFIDIVGSATVSVGTSLTVTSSGQISMGGARLNTASVNMSGILLGWGTIEGSLANNGGYVHPSAGPPYSLTVTGNYTQTASGELSEEWGDTLFVKGDATLSGYLSVGVSYHHLPQPGSTYTAMTFSSLSGKFTHVSVENGGTVKYTNDSAVVTYQ